jgi:hypothetical protein
MTSAGKSLGSVLDAIVHIDDGDQQQQQLLFVYGFGPQ